MWKDIKGWEGLYQVSDQGEIKNIKTGFRTHDINSCGYHRITLYNKDHDPPKERFLVHRLVASTFIDNPKNLPVVNHVDLNIDNNSVDNLEWTTTRDNELYSKYCGSKIYKPYRVCWNNGCINDYDTLSELASILNVTNRCVTNWLHGISKGYVNYGIESIMYI